MIANVTSSGYISGMNTLRSSLSLSTGLLLIAGLLLRVARA
jgi:hypothetical protein